MNIRTKPIYDNCLILNPEGEELSRCSKKRVNWYIRKNLAIPVNENTIQLLFEPKGIPNINFNTQVRYNNCVVCGIDNNLSLHHIIPKCFTKYFSKELKAHNTHDVVSLCRSCHDIYEYKANYLKKQLANMLDITVKNGYNRYSYKITQTLHKALNNINRNIKVNTNKNIICKYTGLSFNSPDLVEDAKRLLKPIPYGEYTTSKINSKDLIYLWRSHFMEEAKPKYMPLNWSINNE
jgi:5-methylcytosine-specific restriction endonuclease McrA